MKLLQQKQQDHARNQIRQEELLRRNLLWQQLEKIDQSIMRRMKNGASVEPGPVKATIDIYTIEGKDFDYLKTHRDNPDSRPKRKLPVTALMASNLILRLVLVVQAAEWLMQA